MKSIGVFISSRKRPEKQKTLKYIPKSFLPRTRIIVYPEEYNDYCKTVGKNLVLATSNSIERGLSHKRQWILDTTEFKYVVMLDDDLDFFRRTKDMKLVRATADDMKKLFILWAKWMIVNDIPMVGVSQRFGNNRITENYIDCTRVMTAYALNRDVLKKEGIRMNVIGAMQDFHTALSLLEKGYKNRVAYNFAHSQNSGTEGGCSIYRTSDFIKQSAYTLALLHPTSVSVVAKMSKSSWKTMEKKAGVEGTVRTDVNIQWKKAYKPKIAIKNKQSFLSKLGE